MWASTRKAIANFGSGIRKGGKKKRAGPFNRGGKQFASPPKEDKGKGVHQVVSKSGKGLNNVLIERIEIKEEDDYIYGGISSGERGGKGKNCSIGSCNKNPMQKGEESISLLQN